MIEARLGYDESAAKAMRESYATDEPEDGFIERARKSGLFFGLFDPKPVGAVLFDGPFVHTAILPRARGQCREAFEQCLQYALARIPYLCAYAKTDNVRAQKLIEAMHFEHRRDFNGYKVYMRQAP